MKTKSEIRDKVGEMLGVIGRGDTLEAGAATDIEDVYDQVYAELKHEGYATWASTASVPAEFVPHMVAKVAYTCIGNPFSVSEKRKAIVAEKVVLADRMIPYFATPRYEPHKEPTDY